MVEIRNATAEDCVFIGDNLSELDSIEVGLRTGAPGCMAVYRSWELSRRCKVAIYRGQPRCVWGVVDTGYRVGELWMLSTDISAYARQFLTYWDTAFWSVAEGYRYLSNYIWPRQTLYRRLMRLSGFVFDEEDTLEAHGETLVKFMWRNDHV